MPGLPAAVQNLHFRRLLTCAGNRLLSPDILYLCDCPPSSISRLDQGFSSCTNCDLALVDVFYSDSLDSIILEFGDQVDIQTDVVYRERSTELCRTIFDEKSYILIGGEKAECQMRDIKFEVYLGRPNKVTVGTQLTLRQVGGIIKFKKCIFPFVKLETQKVKYA